MHWGCVWRRCSAWGQGAEQMEAVPRAAQRHSAQRLLCSNGQRQLPREEQGTQGISVTQAPGFQQLPPLCLLTVPNMQCAFLTTTER